MSMFKCDRNICLRDKYCRLTVLAYQGGFVLLPKLYNEEDDMMAFFEVAERLQTGL